MSEALDALRERNLHDVTLESGLEVTLRLPKNLEYVKVMRTIPTPILDKAYEVAQSTGTDEQKQAELTERLPFEEQLEIAAKLDALVNMTVKRIATKDGMRDVEPGENVADELSEEECFEIVQYARRTKPLPKASAPTTSAGSSMPPGLGSTALPVNGTESIQRPSLTTTSSP